MGASARAHRPALARSVRATREEKAHPLPGDELIPDAIGSLTHAVTIRSGPHEVWPWLVQMGAGTRAGWYSYDVLDNGGRPVVTWAFVLEEAGPGWTRLIVRARGGRGYRLRGLPSWVSTRIVPAVHFVMQRKQLLGIARRAEAREGA